jgi:nucleoside-triphosphatase
MKILLTGPKRIGKSTVINTFIKEYKLPAHGVITFRMYDEKNENQGFKSVTLDGKKEKVIAHRSLIKSDYFVGNNHFVDKKAVDEIYLPEIEKGIEENSLIVIDEIAKMQAISEDFLSEMRKIANSSANLLGTIVYKDEPFAEEFKKHHNIVLVEVTVENRDILPELLSIIFNNVSLLSKLTKPQTFLLNDLLRTYFKRNQFIQIQKLFNNALVYLSENYIKQIGASFIVKGQHGEYTVTKNPYSCTCDLFNGKGEYAGNAGECSHIQTIKLFNV